MRDIAQQILDEIHDIPTKYNRGNLTGVGVYIQYDKLHPDTDDYNFCENDNFIEEHDFDIDTVDDVLESIFENCDIPDFDDILHRKGEVVFILKPHYNNGDIGEDVAIVFNQTIEDDD